MTQITKMTTMNKMTKLTKSPKSSKWPKWPIWPNHQNYQNVQKYQIHLDYFVQYFIFWTICCFVSVWMWGAMVGTKKLPSSKIVITRDAHPEDFTSSFFPIPRCSWRRHVTEEAASAESPGSAWKMDSNNFVGFVSGQFCGGGKRVSCVGNYWGIQTRRIGKRKSKFWQ